jgi:hypothetical protein
MYLSEDRTLCPNTGQTIHGDLGRRSMLQGRALDAGRHEAVLDSIEEL